MWRATIVGWADTLATTTPTWGPLLPTLPNDADTGASDMHENAMVR